MKPTMTVPRAPAARPAFLKAAGIARIPDPKEDFSRCTVEPIVLLEEEEILIITVGTKARTHTYTIYKYHRVTELAQLR